MRYYEVLVGDMQFHGKSALTYASSGLLAPGMIVRIALRSRSVLGIILRTVPEPSFDVKQVSAIAPYPPIPSETLTLITWLYAYYPAPFGAIIRQFLPPSTVFPRSSPSGDGSALRRPPSSTAIPQLPPLTHAQEEVLQRISNSGSYLLHGITGSGKTRIYQELAEHTLAQQRSVVILTPEIGLTEQLVQSFTALKAPVYVLHSRLTNATRRNIWYKILAEESPSIIIGPRSALFAPVRNVGLIVMDESHDQAYKSDSSPRYRTDRVGAYLAHLHGAIFLAGSATPNVEDVYVAKAKSRPVITLTALARNFNITNDIKTIVDMRDKANFSRSRILTKPLLDALAHALHQGEQSLLFLNRRGTAAAILCQNCGWRALCPHCDLPLTYHADRHVLLCHACGRQQPLLTSCSDCGSTDILLKSIGTKAVVDEVRRLFPTAKIRRFDTDVSKEDQIESQLADLQAGDGDILVGTQMITKGLDLPRLAVVGVLNADASLLIPDFSAAEHTYQLIAQVVGRVGRGHRHSTTILQTYDPKSPLLLHALNQDWQAFYESELAERQMYRFPPFTYLLKLWCLRASASGAEKAAATLKTQLLDAHPALMIDGPAPSFHPRESGKYRWQLIVKSASRQSLVAIVQSLPSGWQHDLDPINLL